MKNPITVTDSSVIESFTDKVGHGPPYTHEEVAKVISLGVTYAHDVSAARYATGAYRIRFSGCEVSSIDFMADLPGLKDIQITDSTLRSIEVLRRCPKVESVFIDCNLIEDLTPLLDLPKLKDVRVFGNPLSEESFYTVLPELHARLPSRRIGGVDCAFLKAPDEESWKLTRALYERGIEAVCYYLDVGYSKTPVFKVTAPGLSYSDAPDLYSISAKPADIWRLLEEPDLTLKTFMDGCRALR